MNGLTKKMMHVGKGVLAFTVLYFLAAVVMEGIVIAVLNACGYDVLHGDMPADGTWTELIQLYGFMGFALLTILFHKIIRKKKLSDMRMRFSGRSMCGLLLGILVGALLVSVAILLLTAFGAYRFAGAADLNLKMAFAYFGAYFVQASAEEIMCRGFLQNYMEEKVSKITAILVSAAAFTAPHVSTILEFDFRIAAVSLLNLLLVSMLFSLSMLRFQSVWVPAGLHAGWNYMLSHVCGLELSGSKGIHGMLYFSVNPAADWLNGGAYGIEAGLIVSMILIAGNAVLLWQGRRK